MKIKIVYRFFLMLSCFFILACSSDDPKVDPGGNEKEPQDPIENPIQKLTVTNYPEANISIDNTEKKININFDIPARLKALEINFDLLKGVRLSKEASFYDLSSEYILKINNNSNEQEYKITATVKDADYSGWTIDNIFGELPEYIKLYNTSSIQGKTGIGYIAVIDMSQPFSCNVLGEANGVKTPSSFYDAEPADNKPAIMVNTGYFTSGSNGLYGVSLLVKEGVTIRHNTNSVSRESMTYYPTRSAVGFDKDGVPEINWVYTDGIVSPTYAYPIPSPNIVGEKPQSKPFQAYPKNGKLWRLQTATGAGPIAVKNGKALSFEDMKYELLDGDGSADRPRGAIGLTSDNKMILYVNQGNGFDNLYGFSWEEVGREMVKLGCYDVMHFDGGGSVCMLVNGKPVIKGGEVNSVGNNPEGEIQRAVATVLVIR